MTRIHSFCVLACLYLISNNDYISTTANDRFEPGRIDENSSLIDRSKNEPIVYNACVTSFYFPPTSGTNPRMGLADHVLLEKLMVISSFPSFHPCSLF